MRSPRIGLQWVIPSQSLHALTAIGAKSSPFLIVH
jgi:hypothetical protein